MVAVLILGYSILLLKLGKEKLEKIPTLDKIIVSFGLGIIPYFIIIAIVLIISSLFNISDEYLPNISFVMIAFLISGWIMYHKYLK